jgi:hypothetical protein
VIGAEDPLARRIEREVARPFALRGDAFNKRELSRRLIDGEDDNAVVTAIGTVEEPAIGMNLQLSASVRVRESLG